LDATTGRNKPATRWLLALANREVGSDGRELRSAVRPCSERRRRWQRLLKTSAPTDGEAVSFKLEFAVGDVKRL